MQRFSPLSQYVCSKCGSVFDTDRQVDVSVVIEDCPTCGAFLANTLTKRNVATELEPTQPKFQTAYDLTRFKIDIEKISKFMPLASTGSLCIAGYNANLLLTRLCVRALLPANYGGLDSPHVIIVDAGNKSDFYQTVNFVKQYGLNLKSALDRIIVSRTFTIYQLKSLLLREVPKITQKYQASIVIIPGLLDLFDDPNINKREAKKVIARIMNLINDLSNKMLVIASFQESEYAELVMPNFDKRIILNGEDRNRLNVELYNGERTAKIALLQRELKLVQAKS
jgi:hypothetical protein